MLKKICFILKPHSPVEAGEAQRALRVFPRMGLSGEICRREPADRVGTLCLYEDGETLHMLRAKGFCAAGYSHAGNAGERFDGASYVVQEPDLVDADSYEKIYQREAGLPWTILETRRCLVREFVEEDLESLYGLYDPEACRFLEPPSPDRERERAILRAYIDRIYGLYGFGHWAVLLKAEAGQENADPVLAGRVGFSALTAGQEQELLRLGVPVRPDADFGFLIGQKWRGTGLAMEVCEALLDYGFSRLGFSSVRADAHRDNGASQRLLQKLGFSPVGEGEGEKRVYILTGSS